MPDRFLSISAGARDVRRLIGGYRLTRPMAAQQIRGFVEGGAAACCRRDRTL